MFVTPPKEYGTVWRTGQYPDTGDACKKKWTKEMGNCISRHRQPDAGYEMPVSTGSQPAQESGSKAARTATHSEISPRPEALRRQPTNPSASRSLNRRARFSFPSSRPTESGAPDPGDAEVAARQQAISRIASSIGENSKNNSFRAEYEAKVSGLSAYENTLRAQGISERGVAQSLHQARRDLGVQYKEATPDPLREYIYNVNWERYGDPLGPSFDSLEAKYKGNYNKIIEGAKRPNPNVRRLLSGFSDWLNRQPSLTIDRYSQCLGGSE